MFGEKWDSAQATIVDRKNLSHGDAHSLNPRHAYVVELQTPTGETQRVEMKDPVGGLPFKVCAPGVGQTVTVKVHWKKLEVKLDYSDPRIARVDPTGKAVRQAENDRFAGNLSNPGTAAGPTASGGSRLDAVRNARELSKTDPETERAAMQALGVTTIDSSATAPTAAPEQVNVAAEVAKLADLKSQGLLNDDEFAAAKQKLLGT